MDPREAQLLVYVIGWGVPLLLLILVALILAVIAIALYLRGKKEDAAFSAGIALMLIVFAIVCPFAAIAVEVHRFVGQVDAGEVGKVDESEATVEAEHR